MRRKVIYVEVRHLNFWWGIYGFCNKTSWEDMILYQKWGRGYKKLAWTCICTKPYFENGLEDLKDATDEREYVVKISEFFSGEQIRYHYYYDSLGDRDFYEVPFEAQRKQERIKPRSIETWYPSSGVDREVLDNCAKAFCKKFLDIEVERVELKGVVSREDALNSYLEEMKLWQQAPETVFSDSLVQQLEIEWGIPKEKVLEC